MRKIAAAFMLSLVIAFMLSCGALLSHGAVANKTKPNSIGAVISDISPVTSVVGVIVDAGIKQDRDGRVGVNLRIHPKSTYALFDVSVMFCGTDMRLYEEKEGKTFFVSGWHAFTYKLAASRLVDGIPCHELDSVDKLEAQNGN